MTCATFLLRHGGRLVLICMLFSAGLIHPIGSQYMVLGPGVKEIRIHVLGEWRVLYVARIASAVYVLHAFQKKSREIRREDIELARQRYRQIEE